jgi:uridine kinase
VKVIPVTGRPGIYIVGIAGPSASGKTTLARALQHHLQPTPSVLLTHDDYYRDLAHLPAEKRAAHNFDDPQALETELLLTHLQALRRGEAIQRPVYDFSHHIRTPQTVTVAPAPVVILEGLFILALPALREACDLRVYVDTPADICLARRILRDVQERGRTVQSCIDQYLRFVRPAQEALVLPSRVHADLIATCPQDAPRIAAHIR